MLKIEEHAEKAAIALTDAHDALNEAMAKVNNAIALNYSVYVAMRNEKKRAAAICDTPLGSQNVVTVRVPASDVKDTLKRMDDVNEQFEKNVENLKEELENVDEEELNKVDVDAIAKREGEKLEDIVNNPVFPEDDEDTYVIDVVCGGQSEASGKADNTDIDIGYVEPVKEEEPEKPKRKGKEPTAMNKLIENRDDIVHAYEERGWSITELSEFYKVSPPTIRKFLYNEGIYIRGIAEQRALKREGMEQEDDNEALNF